MQYPFSVMTPAAGASTTHYRTAAAAEHAVVQQLRSGHPWAGVVYLRRPLVLFVAPGKLVLEVGGWNAVVTVPAEVLLTGEAAFLARREAWVAAGSRVDGEGRPITPRLGTPLLAAIEAEVAKLGDAVKPLPRGKARQTVFRILTERGMNETQALTVLDLIKGYLK